MISVLPWHQKPFAKFIATSDRLHHGLLINGISGIGKREFSIALAQFLLCQTKNTENSTACGQCQNCTLFTVGSHPDFHVLITEEETMNGRIELLGNYSERYQDSISRGKKKNPGKVIPVDHVRTLIGRMQQSPHIANSKVALILPADRMNTSAANALLKLLEEPPENSYLILVTQYTGFLPATIRSRCVCLSLPGPSNLTASIWLNEQTMSQDGENLMADATTGPLDILIENNNGQFEQRQETLDKIIALINLHQDPLELAVSLSKQEPVSLLGWLQQICCDLIRLQTAGVQPSWGNKICANVNSIAPKNLYTLYDSIGEYRNMARDQLNIQLALEELFIQILRLSR